MGDKRNNDDLNSSRRSGSDDPPNSRLFIVCNKHLIEDDFREAFSKFGEIEEIRVVRDRSTGEKRGVTYIKYAKTSQAAAAMEEMNGKCVGSSNRHIKVMIAAKKDHGSLREGNEEERMLRLFIIIPKSMTDDEVQDYFKQFGDIDYVSVVRDRDTRDSKGFAYVKYFKFSHAAAAFENCDKKYKAVFAEPRKSKVSSDYNDYNTSMRKKVPPSLLTLDLPSTGTENYTKLHVITAPHVTQDQLWRLFDIVPGLDYCQLETNPRTRGIRGQATVVYTTAQAAAYAREKLHGFEYPPGTRLIVRPEVESFNNRPMSSQASEPGSSHLQSDLAHLAETIAQATKLIKSAGLTPEALMSSTTGDSFCNVELPPTQPLANVDEKVAARCFIVCTPHPPPVIVLRDAFCRFGGLIDVYLLTNKNCGYVKYAQKESAEKAISTLHGAELCGIRLKVMEAEERQDDDRRKRLKIDS